MFYSATFYLSLPYKVISIYHIVAGKMESLEDEKKEWAAQMEDLRSSLEEDHRRKIREVLDEAKEAFQEEQVRNIFFFIIVPLSCGVDVRRYTPSMWLDHIRLPPKVLSL